MEDVAEEMWPYKVVAVEVQQLLVMVGPHILRPHAPGLPSVVPIKILLITSPTSPIYVIKSI
jgi:hypothetical protein